MKILMYWPEPHFMSDAAYREAIKTWGSGQALHYDKESENLLPVPKQMSGLPRDLQGLNIAWSFKRNRWLAFQQSVGIPDRNSSLPAGILERKYDTEDGWYWEPLNPRNEHEKRIRENMTDEECVAFMKSEDCIAVDKILADRELRERMPLEQLLTRHKK